MFNLDKEMEEMKEIEIIEMRQKTFSAEAEDKGFTTKVDDHYLDGLN